MDPNKGQGKKATKAQPVSRRLQSRLDDYDGFVKTVDSKLRGGYNRPGSQNRSK